MRSLPKPAELKITEPVQVELIIEQMAGSIGIEKARAVVEGALAELGLQTAGLLKAEAAEALLSMLATQTGLVGLAAKVTKQMVRLQIAPKKPAF